MTPTLTVPFTSAEYQSLWPIAVVGVGALLALLVDLLAPMRLRRPLALLVGVIALALGGWLALDGWGDPIAVFANAFVTGRVTVAFEEIALVGALLSLLLMQATGRGDQIAGAVSLVLWSTAGAMLMAGAANLMMIFLGLELLSLALYCLCGLGARGTAREAALKYLILSSTASGFMLYGMALLFGATGSVNLSALAAPSGSPVLFTVGIGLFFVGIAFKLSLVPFHEWTPDVYAGAPLPVTAFMSVVTKAGVLAVLARMVDGALPASSLSVLMPPLWVIAGLSMIIGNVAALAQSDIKRLLGYSGIAQIGYVVAALVQQGDDGLRSAIYYLTAYTFMNLGAFAVLTLLSGEREEGARIEAFRGLGARRPVLAAAMTLFLLSLAGIPPTAGFTGKVFILGSTIAAGQLWLGLLLVVGTVVSLYAYLKIVCLMYAPSFGRGSGSAAVASGSLPWIGVAVCALAVLALALHPLAPIGSLATLP